MIIGPFYRQINFTSENVNFFDICFLKSFFKIAQKWNATFQSSLEYRQYSVYFIARLQKNWGVVVAEIFPLEGTEV